MLRKYQSIILLISLSSSAQAWTLTGKLKFNRKPPDVALVYLPEDKSLNLQNKAIIDQKDKKFLHKVVITKPNDTIVLKNSDSINHNIFANDRKQGVKFDIGLAEPGVTMERKADWGEDKIVKIGCKIHPRMRAWIAPIQSAYHSIVELKSSVKEYDIKIENIPEKYTKVILWMPSYKQVDAALDKANNTASMDLHRRKKVKGSVEFKRMD